MTDRTRHDLEHDLRNQEVKLQSLRRLLEETESALERIMDYALTGAAARDVDPTEQPQFIAATRILGRLKLMLESERDVARAVEMGKAWFGSFK
jgi:hypothetical protein